MRFLNTLIAAITLSTSLVAGAVDDKIRNLISPQNYLTHQRLIELIFRDRTQFYHEDGRPDVIAVVTTLKENGLLDIFHSHDPRGLQATFRTAQSPTLFLKVIGDALTDLGYNFYVTDRMHHDEYRFEWTISYRSDHTLDPTLFARRLAPYGVRIDDIRRKANNWIYDLSALNPILPEAQLLSSQSDVPLTLHSPQGSYWVQLEGPASKLGVRRRMGGTWFPYAAFYDRDLKILEVFALIDGVRAFEVTVPDGAHYLRLTDNYTTENLRHGIVLWLESKN